MMLRGICSLIALLPLACSVAEVEPEASASAVNGCQSSADCGGNGCSGGICVANRTSLTSLVLEVTRPETSFGSSGLTFYQTFSGLDERGERFDIDIPPAATVIGRASVAVQSNNRCQPTFVGSTPAETLVPASDGSIPVDVEFFPSERLLGIATPTYTARFEMRNDEDGPRYVFPVNVPPGNYDVYLQPRAAADPDCPVPPPFLLLNQPVSTGGQFDVILPQPETLTVTVRWPENNLKDSVVEVLDPISGRVLSTASVLPEPSIPQPMSSLGFVSTVTVSYQPVRQLGVDGKFETTAGLGKEIVRLTPIAEHVADRPVILAVRDATNAQGELLQTSPLPSDVIVEGLALVKGETTPVEAAVTLTALQLDGFDPGVFASFTRTVPVKPDGHFSLNVPPGRYRVDAVPRGGCAEVTDEAEATCLASVHTSWEISRQTSLGMGGMGSLIQGGKVVEFERASALRGRAQGPLGPVSGASVRISASSLGAKASLLTRALGEAPQTPRASAALAGKDGSFSFLADPGVFDLFVQPDPTTGFGWYVRPSLEVTAAGQDLRTLNVPLPVVYQGFVTSSVGTYNVSNTVPDALIRAYYVLNPDEPERRATIQVAEARADRNGAFKLLIPASLDSGNKTR